MNARNSVQALYASELRDLMSATEQFIAVTKIMGERGRDLKLRELLRQCARDNLAHHEVLSHLVREADPRAPLEPCEGMRWLVKDVIQQLKRAAHHGEHVLDWEILSEYQRLSRYHLARVGTAAAYARGLAKSAHAAELAHILADLTGEEVQAQQLVIALEPGNAETRPGT